MARKTLAEQTLPHLTKTSITLLRILRQAESIHNWKTLRIINANRLGLLRVRKNRLYLSALGRKVAERLPK